MYWVITLEMENSKTFEEPSPTNAGNSMFSNYSYTELFQQMSLKLAPNHKKLIAITQVVTTVTVSPKTLKPF